MTPITWQSRVLDVFLGVNNVIGDVTGALFSVIVSCWGRNRLYGDPWAGSWGGGAWSAQVEWWLSPSRWGLHLCHCRGQPGHPSFGGQRAVKVILDLTISRSSWKIQGRSGTARHGRFQHLTWLTNLCIKDQRIEIRGGNGRYIQRVPKYLRYCCLSPKRH